MRLEQKYGSNEVITHGDTGIARAEADGLLRKRDHVVDRSGIELAPSETVYGAHKVAVQRERGLEFRHAFVVLALGAQYQSLDEMRKRITGRGCQNSINQPFRTDDVGRGRVSNSAEHAIHQRVRQID